MLAMWASTVFRAIPSRSPIAWFDRPSAISARTARSRSVRSSSGTRDRRPTSTATTAGSMTEPPFAIRLIASARSSMSETRSLSRYPTPPAPSASRRSANDGSTCCDSTRMPTAVPCSARIACAASALHPCGLAASGCPRLRRPDGARASPAATHRRHRLARPPRMRRQRGALRPLGGRALSRLRG
jgi:hypothetical protein